jgi:LPS O-antigen subunit length determinant protein (WzzB/FepE family)
VPLRRLAKTPRSQDRRQPARACAVGYGVLVGGTSGSGVILLSLLMASGSRAPR